ncbi:hypothetical protein [Rhodopseudomonas palustris]|uniref:hypothetical protein n=1 Tax=Rhodopseudomonas palustris TaxID=1076 RepID=UPI003A0FF903
MQHKFSCRPVVLTLVLAMPLLAGCSGTSDLLSRDADWFARPGRVFIKNISIETPPLTPDKPVTAEDLISADGMCPGMAQPGAADANAQGGDPAAPAMTSSGTVALGHTECDVARGAGAPDSVNLSTNERGQRVVLLTYARGPRAGIYTFTAGRLTSIERVAEPAPQPRAAKKRSRS